MPVILYDVKSRGAEAYLALAREVWRARRRRPHESRRTMQPRSTNHETTRALVASSCEFRLESWRHMEKRPALGKGLSALIPDAPEPRTSPRRSRHRSPRAERLSAARARRRRAARRARALDQVERRHPADRRPQGRRPVSDHRRRAPLARRAARRPAARAGRRARRRSRARSNRSSRWRSSRTSSAKT